MDLFSSPPPLAPPTTEGNRLAWLRLLRSYRVGTSTFLKLMAEHEGDALAAIDALPRVAAAAGVDDYRPCSKARAQDELDRGQAAGAALVFRGAPDYPTALAQTEDAPILLWVKGDPTLLETPSIAMVGARNASSLGQRMATTLAQGLGNAGATVVSGLARGIDTAVHRAALDTGTVAVVAGGIDIVYPAENAELMAEIGERGALVSEMPPGLQPQARHFPRRNRIIAGLARGVVVVEAAPKSGSLITARDAADLGREVMAVPGHPIDGRAAGCNLLIRDGATLVRSADDVCLACGLVPAPRPEAAPSGARQALQEPPADAGFGSRIRAAVSQRLHPNRPAKGPVHPNIDAHILALLGPSPLAEEQLLRDVGGPSDHVAAALVELEMQGKIARQPGGLLTRAN